MPSEERRRSRGPGRRRRSLGRSLGPAPLAAVTAGLPPFIQPRAEGQREWSFHDMRRYTSLTFPSTPLQTADPESPVLVQEPGSGSVWGALRRNCHWKCLVLSGMIETCVAVVGWCQAAHSAYSTFAIALPLDIVAANPTNSNAAHNGPSPPLSHIARDSRENTGPCDQGYNFIPIAFAVMLYVVYVMECWHCRTRLDLLGQTDVGSVYAYAEEARRALPIVWWRALCYHYIRRTRQITRYRNGDAITTTQVYYERVNSHSAGSVFLYHDCGVKDISKALAGLEAFPVTKVRFTKGFVFANLQAANEFEEQRARFFQENEQRDDYMEVREGLDLAQTPFRETMIAFSDPQHRPWYTSQWAFWLLSLLLLSWPLRVLVEYKTAYVHFQMTKLFGTNYLSPSSANYTGPLTRASTMDSRDLDMVLASNFVIVPSYSEALLMDPVASHAHVIHDRQGNVHIETRQRLFRTAAPLNPDASQPLSNEGPVIPNYGALDEADRSLVYCSRSRSMSFARRDSRSGSGPGDAPSGPPPPIAPLGRGRREGRWGSGRRSISFGSLAGLAGSARGQVGPAGGGYSALPMGEEEPPPPYDVAMQMCQPLVQRLSSSFQRLASFRFARSASRDLQQSSESSSSRPGSRRHKAPAKDEESLI